MGIERQKAIVQQQQENILQAAQAAGIEAADVDELNDILAENCPGYVSPGWCLFNNFAMTLYRSKEDAIEEIKNEKLKSKNEAVYDLSGRRVNGSMVQEFNGSRSSRGSSIKFQGSGFNEKLPKGVYIRDGKKVLVP